MDFDFIKKLTFSIILLLTACLTSSQNVDVGSRSSSLNNCSVALSTVWASNQSGMTQFTKKGVGAFYSTRFMMRELSTKAVTIFIPLQKGTIGLKYQYFGYELFNNQLMGLYYAVKIYHQISIGVQMDLIMVGSANRKIQITPTCEIGLQAKLNDKVTLGLWTYNPIRVKTHKG